MPAKKTVTKSSSKTPAKQNLAKKSLLAKTRKFDLRIVGVIIVVLVIAIGYLFVRLSKAATEVPCKQPTHTTNCYRLPGEGYTQAGGGTLINKYDGTTSWTAGVNHYLTMTDYVNSNSMIKYCYYVQFTSDYGTKYQIEVQNKTAGVQQASRTEQVSKSPANNPQTVKCTDPFREVSSSDGSTRPNYGSTTPQKNEVKFKVLSGTALVYKMTRVLVAGDNTVPVSQPAPGAAKSATTPAPAVTPAPATPAPVATPQCPDRTFSQGVQDNCVILIQQRLKDLGYDPGAVDGIFGEKTFNAVKVFQQKSNMTVDGVVGPGTWRRLFDANAARKS